MVLSATGSVVFLASGALLAEGADLASAGWLAVAVALGSAVGAVSPTLPMMPPRLSAATAVMIRAGHPNRLGFFGCC
jgi:hypothetical protein